MNIEIQWKNNKDLWVTGTVSDNDVKKCLYNFDEDIILVKVYENNKPKYWSWGNLKTRTNIIEICKEEIPEYLI